MKIKKLLQLFLLPAIFMMTNCQTEEIISNTKNIEDSIQKTKAVNIVSLKTIPVVENFVNGIKKEKTITNKTINNFDLNQEKIIELSRENGDKSYSILIEKTFKDDEPYTVENLNILSENGDYKALITKWIPSDGKPFYDIEKFIGDLQYLDLNGNLLHTLKIGTTIKTAKSNQTAKSQLVIEIGCWSYEMLPCGCSGSNYEIVSSSYICGGGGGTTSGTTSTGGTTGTGGGGGGYTGSGTTTFVPNIPTEDEVERKRYNTFLVSLNKEQYNFLGYNQDINLQTFTYLQENEFTSSYKTLAKELINVMIVTDAVENLSNTITGDPIEFYLVLQYKHSNLLNLSSFSINSNTIQVGSYTLIPHYKKDGTLVFYTAARWVGNNLMHDIEYIVKPSGLTNFQNKIDLYTASANLFYLNSTPNQGQIALAIGNYFTGLKNMWADALTNPQYYLYLGHVFVGVATNLNAVESTTTSFEGKIKFTSYTNPSRVVSVDINNRSFIQYRQLIQNKFPNSSWIPNASGEVELFLSGNIKYVGRFQNNSGYAYVIDYYRNGMLIGKFRFFN